MQKLTAKVALTALTCVVAPGVQAAFNAELQPPPAPRPSLDTWGSATAVTQIGEGVAAAAPGFGNAVPLSQAVRMLLPDDWTYSPGAEVGSVTVSWTGGHTWLEALRQIGESCGVRFLVDWPRRIVYSEPSAAGRQNASPVVGQAGVSWGTSVLPSWKLEIGGLREQLVRWADRAHYHLYWPRSIADLSVQVPATLNGEFLEAIKQLSGAPQAVSAGLKLHVYEQNQALVVEEY
jgi:hypothetical protein